MKTLIAIEHREDVDVRAVVAKAFAALRPSVAPDLYDVSRLPPALREFYAIIRDRFLAQSELTFEQVAARMQKEIEAAQGGGWRNLLRAGLLFALSASALASIVEPIEDLKAALLFEHFGIRPKRSVFHRILAAGLLADGTPRLAETAFQLGRLGDLGETSFDEALKLFAPLAQQHRATVDLLSRSGARYVSGFVDSLKHDILGLLEMRDAHLGRLTGALTPENEAEIRQMVAQAIQGEQGWRSLSAAFKRRFGATTRDWDRVAYTEMENDRQIGRALEIATTSPRGMRTVVYKIPRPDACRLCKELYLLPDGSPRPFTLEELFENGDNIGRVAPLAAGASPTGSRQILQGERAGEVAEEYLPTIPVVHPGCRCQLVVKTEEI